MTAEDDVSGSTTTSRQGAANSRHEPASLTIWFSYKKVKCALLRGSFCFQC